MTTYLKLCTEYYDLEQHKDNDLAIAFFLDYAKQANGLILEPMCGTGRFLIPILTAGFDIEGFDASPYMLDVLQKKLALISNKKSLVWQQYVQHFRNNKSYNLIFVPYGSWCLITDIQESLTSLQNLYDHLSPNGKLVLEIETVNSVPSGLDIWHRGVHTRNDGSYIALNTLPSYDPKTQIFRAICRYESIVNNKIESTETEDFQMYLYLDNQMEKLLRSVGFKSIIKYGDYNKSNINALSPIIIYECTK